MGVTVKQVQSLSFAKSKKSSGMDDADGCTPMCIHLMPQDCTLKNGENGKFGLCTCYTIPKVS